MRVDEIKQGCDKCNLKYEDYFGDIKIKSKFDTWLLHEKGNGKLVIYHFNFLSARILPLLKWRGELHFLLTLP